MKDYVREYFDRHADEWVGSAYVDEPLPPRFPTGPERVRLALEAVAPAMSEGSSLVDLGCGGGQLLLHAARLGWRPTGVDAAPGMINEARELTSELDVDLIEASYDDSGLPTAAFDAVTALGLIEYLAQDGPLFAEAARLLRPGGRFAVSCRNRLFNLRSANEYTEREIALGEADVLIRELRELVGRSAASDVLALGEELDAAGAELAEAARRDAEDPAESLFHHPSAFREERRQHTPSALAEAAAPHGFRSVGVFALHPHPLPPRAEALAPRTYNRLALAWQRALERSPLGLACSSAFVGVFECSPELDSR